MTRLKRLETVHTVLGDRADQAARALARSRERVEEETRRLEQLRRFRDDYRQEFAGSGQDVIDAFRLRDFNAFVARLDEAIARQQQHVDSVRREAEQVREHWQAQRRRADGMEKVVEGHREVHRRHEADVEQSRSDEIAMRRFRDREPQ